MRTRYKVGGIVLLIVVLLGAVAASVVMKRTTPAPPSGAASPQVAATTVTAHAPIGHTDVQASIPVQGDCARQKPQATAPSARSATATPPPDRPRHNGADGRAQFAAHRAAFGLMHLFRGIGRLGDDGDNPLTPAQAKAILAILTPLRTQKTLTSTEAEGVTKRLEAELTPAQLTAVQSRSMRGGGPGGPGGPGGAPAGGAPRQRGIFPSNGAGGAGAQPGAAGGASRQRGGFSPNGAGGPGGRPGAAGGPPRFVIPENYNPFYTKNTDDNPMAARMAERMQDAFDALKEKAAQ